MKPKPNESQPVTAKTIGQWLETLPPGIRGKAIANMDNEEADAQANTAPDALAGAFDWEASPEGFKFWDDVHDGLTKPAKPLHTERERLLALACESGWHRIADSEWWLLPAQYLTEDELVRRLEREAEDPEPDALTPRQRETVAAMIREALRPEEPRHAYPSPPDDGQEWVDMRERKPSQEDLPIAVWSDSFGFATYADLIPIVFVKSEKYWRPAKLPPPLPDDVPAPKKEWVYAGVHILPEAIELSYDISAFSNGWGHEGYYGDGITFHYAVRVGSEIQKRLFPDYRP